MLYQREGSRERGFSNHQGYDPSEFEREDASRPE